MLVYRTVGDSRVRPDHEALDGIAKPVDDPFWNTFYPPNGFLCRCTVDQEVAEIPTTKLTQKEDAELKKGIPKLFQMNVGKDTFIFKEDHPYFNVKGERPLVREIYIKQSKKNFGMIKPETYLDKGKS